MQSCKERAVVLAGSNTMETNDHHEVGKEI
jgi:hypothetical protein